jgi:broad specificity phosphatase PhoE
MVDIVLVRHASTAWSGVRYCGVSDPPLTSAGLAEAHRLAAWLAPTLDPSWRVVASPSRRATGTASAIVTAARLPGAEIDPRWREADVGLAEGRTFDELARIAPEVATALAGGELEIDWPGGETSASLAARVGEAMTDLAADGRPVLVVSHAGPILHACAWVERREVSPDDVVAPATARHLVVAEGSDRHPVLRSSA